MPIVYCKPTTLHMEKLVQNIDFKQPYFGANDAVTRIAAVTSKTAVVTLNGRAKAYKLLTAGDEGMVIVWLIVDSFRDKMMRPARQQFAALARRYHIGNYGAPRRMPIVFCQTNMEKTIERETRGMNGQESSDYAAKAVQEWMAPRLSRVADAPALDTPCDNIYISYGVNGRWTVLPMRKFEESNGMKFLVPINREPVEIMRVICDITSGDTTTQIFTGADLQKVYAEQNVDLVIDKDRMLRRRQKSLPEGDFPRLTISTFEANEKALAATDIPRCVKKYAAAFDAIVYITLEFHALLYAGLPLRSGIWDVQQLVDSVLRTVLLQHPTLRKRVLLVPVDLMDMPHIPAVSGVDMVTGVTYVYGEVTLLLREVLYRNGVPRPEYVTPEFHLPVKPSTRRQDDDVEQMIPSTADPAPPTIADPAPPSTTDQTPPTTPPSPDPTPPTTDPAPPPTTDPVPPSTTDPAPPPTADLTPPSTTDPAPPPTTDPAPPSTADPAPVATTNVVVASAGGVPRGRSEVTQALDVLDLTSHAKKSSKQTRGRKTPASALKPVATPRQKQYRPKARAWIHQELLQKASGQAPGAYKNLVPLCEELLYQERVWLDMSAAEVVKQGLEPTAWAALPRNGVRVLPVLPFGMFGRERTVIVATPYLPLVATTDYRLKKSMVNVAYMRAYLCSLVAGHNVRTKNIIKSLICAVAFMVSRNLCEDPFRYAFFWMAKPTTTTWKAVDQLLTVTLRSDNDTCVLYQTYMCARHVFPEESVIIDEDIEEGVTDIVLGDDDYWAQYMRADTDEGIYEAKQQDIRAQLEKARQAYAGGRQRQQGRHRMHAPDDDGADLPQVSLKSDVATKWLAYSPLPEWRDLTNTTGQQRAALIECVDKNVMDYKVVALLQDDTPYPWYELPSRTVETYQYKLKFPPVLATDPIVSLFFASTKYEQELLGTSRRRFMALTAAIIGPHPSLADVLLTFRPPQLVLASNSRRLLRMPGQGNEINEFVTQAIASFTTWKTAVKKFQAELQEGKATLQDAAAQPPVVFAAVANALQPQGFVFVASRDRDLLPPPPVVEAPVTDTHTPVADTAAAATVQSLGGHSAHERIPDTDTEKEQEKETPIMVYGRPGCPHTEAALDTMRESGRTFTFVKVANAADKAVPSTKPASHTTVPVICHGDTFIGGNSDLKPYLNALPPLSGAAPPPRS